MRRTHGCLRVRDARDVEVRLGADSEMKQVSNATLRVGLLIGDRLLRLRVRVADLRTSSSSAPELKWKMRMYDTHDGVKKAWDLEVEQRVGGLATLARLGAAGRRRVEVDHARNVELQAAVPEASLIIRTFIVSTFAQSINGRRCSRRGEENRRA